MIESSTPSVRWPRRARAYVGTLAALAGLMLGAAAPATAMPSAAVSEVTPEPTPSATPEPGVASFTVAPIGGGTLVPGEPLSVWVTMRNQTFLQTPGGAVALSLGTAPFKSRAELEAWLDGDLGASEVAQVATAAFLPVEGGGEHTMGIVVEADDPVLAGLVPGVHPVAATLTTPGGAFTSTSAVVIPDPAGVQTGIGVVVPITAGPTAEGVLSADELAELTGPEGSLTAQLDAVQGTEAILAVDPAVPAAIRVLGSSAPENAVRWLARLETLANSRFALQYGDADVASQVQAGIVPLMQPISLQSYMSPADFTPVTEETTTPSPSATADPTAPVYPDLPSLLDIGVVAAGVVWPETGTAGRDVVAALADTTIDDEPAVTLIPSTSILAGAHGHTVPARADADGSQVLVYDAAVSAELEKASTVEDAPLRSAHLAAATAHLSFALRETGGAPLLVTVDRALDRSRVALRTAITTALQAPDTAPYTLGALTNAPATPVQVTDAAPDEARVAAASALVSEEESVTEFATVLDDPTQLTGPERAEILQILGEGWRAEPDQWSAAVATHHADTATTLSSVGILRASPIQLITSGAVIPVWVENDLPFPVNVTLLASPEDLRLEVQEVTPVVAQPESNTRVEVPVQAQIGSGDVTIALELRSPAGVSIGQPQVREVHVRADWEGIGLVALTVLAVGFVLLGVIRTVLRRRGRKTDGTAGSPRGSEPAGGAER